MSKKAVWVWIAVVVLVLAVAVWSGGGLLLQRLAALHGH